MDFHISNFGAFSDFDTDRDGFVKCSPRRVAAAKKAIKAGRPAPGWAQTGQNVEVAQAELRIDGWRDTADR